MSIQAKAKNYVKSISIAKKAAITIPYNKKTASKTFKVTVKVSGKASKKFTVKSSKTSVATAKVISGSKVKVTAKKAGVAKITVTTKAKGIAFGDGNLIFTTADMDRWMTSLREYTVLKKETVDEMMTNYSPQSSMSYGYGLFVAKDGSFWHEGAIDSYNSSEYSLPANKYNLFAATNNYDLYKLNALVNYARTIIK